IGSAGLDVVVGVRDVGHELAEGAVDAERQNPDRSHACKPQDRGEPAFAVGFAVGFLLLCRGWHVELFSFMSCIAARICASAADDPLLTSDCCQLDRYWL